MCTDKEKFYLLIVGTRTHAFATSRFYKMFEECADTLLQKQQEKEIVIVQGGCPTGGDYLARQYARIKGYKLEEFSADWEKYGKAAGYIRNREMHKYISKYPNRGVFAWWDGKSKGTAQSFTLAKEFNNPIRIFRFWDFKERGWKK